MSVVQFLEQIQHYPDRQIVAEIRKNLHWIPLRNPSNIYALINSVQKDIFKLKIFEMCAERELFQPQVIIEVLSLIPGGIYRIRLLQVVKRYSIWIYPHQLFTIVSQIFSPIQKVEAVQIMTPRLRQPLSEIQVIALLNLKITDAHRHEVLVCLHKYRMMGNFQPHHFNRQIRFKRYRFSTFVSPFINPDLARNLVPTDTNPCNVCLTYQSNCILLPCRHVNCGSCIIQIYQDKHEVLCPTCRSKSHNVIPFFPN